MRLLERIATLLHDVRPSVWDGCAMWSYSAL